MEDKLNSVDSQYLLIQIFKSLGTEVSSAIGVEFNSGENDTLKEFILACISFSNEVITNSEYCCSFDNTCRSILARQKSSDAGQIRTSDVKQIRKKDYLKALGWDNGVQLNRIEHGTAKMKVDNIKKICSGFTKESDKRFWQNHLLSFFPSTLYLDRNNSNIEYEGLLHVLGNLRKEEQALLAQNLSEADLVKIRSVSDSFLSGCPDDRLGDPPFHLYKTINHLVRQVPYMTIQSLVEDELQTTLVSWYEWKVKWEKAEETDFDYLPAPRLQRTHLLLVAVVFKLEYLDTVRLLQMGGYRLGMNKKDRMIADYFLHKMDAIDELKHILYSDCL